MSASSSPAVLPQSFALPEQEQGERGAPHSTVNYIDEEIEWGDEPPTDQPPRGDIDKPSQVVRTDANGNVVTRPTK
ncbi:hypothetical protein MD484_g4899, partial [Candolleomyces efflorescens]